MHVRHANCVTLAEHDLAMTTSAAATAQQTKFAALQKRSCATVLCDVSKSHPSATKCSIYLPFCHFTWQPPDVRVEYAVRAGVTLPACAQIQDNDQHQRKNDIDRAD